ncbi:UDP-N-acetylmuramoyl-tripeptide--D-alanyl-D-alanine ligase [Candidatus Woesebacteria bacterium]|nr:UDP-N-acetylmuramoyl-tripeptide--D-alanyl-D-alanine ligase [Candidatus Woesebacteria bacterium]
MHALFSTLILSYFRMLARWQLLKIKPTIIGVTGSAGKSSTLEAIAAILSQEHTVKVGRKANSESGIPLDILGLKPTNFSLLDWLRLSISAPLQLLTNWQRYEYYIVEMGIDSPLPPKNMSYLLTILQPDIGVFTSVGAVHSQPFDHLVVGKTAQERADSLTELIAQEKGKLIKSLPQTGLAVLNKDQSALLRGATPTQAKLMTFSHHDAAADIQIAKTTWDENGTHFVFTTGEEKVGLHFSRYILPEHFGGTFAASLCVGLYLGYSPYRSCKLLEKNFELPPGRATLIPGINHSTIIDSSYNSSARPLLDLLEMLKHLRAGRRLALLGDMRELGEISQFEHEKIATVASDILDEVYLVGPLMHQYAAPIFEKKGVPVRCFTNAYTAGQYIRTILKPEDVILVKGSQNTLLLEIAIEQCMNDPETAPAVLCRRGAYWDSQRAALR